MDDQEYLSIYTDDEYEEIDFSKKTHLKYLTIYDCEITNLNPDIFKLKNLKELRITDNSIKNISGIGALKKLKKLDLSYNEFDKIPDSVSELESLEEFNFSYNKITEIPDGILSLHRLKMLDLSGNRITKVPEKVDKLEDLKELDLTNNYIKELPDSICNLNLEILSFSRNKDLTDNYPRCLNRMDLQLNKPEKGDKKFSHFKNNAIYEKAESMIYDEEYKPAVDILNKILKEEQCGQTLYSRGYCYLELKEYHKACEDFTVAIELVSDKERFFAAKGVAHSRLDEFEDAVKNHSKAIELNPSIRNYKNRAFVYKDMGEYAKSVDDFTKAIEIAEGENSGLYVLRAAAYKRMGDLDNSWKDLDTAVEVNPDYILAYIDTFEMYITSKTYRKGLEYIGKHEKHVLDIGDEKYKILFLYLKATVYICLNMDIESLENELKELFDKDINLEWYFGHMRDWLNESELGQDKKDKIGELTDLLESIEN